MRMCWLGFIILLGSIHAQELVKQIKQEEIHQLLRKGGPDEVLGIAEGFERDWKGKKDPVYFNNIATICQALHAYPEASETEYKLLHQLASNILAKTDAGETEAKSFALYNQAEVIKLFLYQNKFTAAFIAATNPIQWGELRSKRTRLVMVCWDRIQRGVIPNYQHKPVSVNVKVPDVGEGPREPIPTGADPKYIKDPVRRRAYEEAIAQNHKNNNENKDQQSYRDLIQLYGPQVERYLIDAYSRAPVDYYELHEYMLLGGFEPKIWERIASAIEAKTGEKIPVGLRTTKE